MLVWFTDLLDKFVKLMRDYVGHKIRMSANLFLEKVAQTCGNGKRCVVGSTSDGGDLRGILKLGAVLTEVPG